jgi:hypothetical protein
VVLEYVREAPVFGARIFLFIGLQLGMDTLSNAEGGVKLSL